MSTTALPSYKKLFGDLDFKKGDDARTVYSPAAYLSDLLQVLEDNFEESDFDGRRDDIKKMLLNAENTFNEVPYLDIVNRVLEKKIGGSVYKKLREARYPNNLPFNLHHERIKKYLNYLNVKPDELYKTFALKVDQYTIARESLGLSPEQYELFTAVSANEVLKQCYNLGTNESLNEKRTKDADFLNAASVSASELRELLFQNLTMRKPGGEMPADFLRIEEFFVNANLGGYAKLDDDNEERIVWSEGESGVPNAWFERANRLIRFSRAIGLSITDLDVILRSCCGNTLDKEAVLTIAMVVNIHKSFDVPVDEVCSLFSEMNTLGQGNTDEPADLFNRIFNHRFAEISKRIISVGQPIHEDYKGFDPLTCHRDLLLPENKEYRMRLQKTLRISEKNLKNIVETYNQHTDIFKGAMNIQSLSLLYRLSRLTEMLDISFNELFGLFDVLDKDPALKLLKNLNILIDTDPLITNCYSIMQGDDIKASSWLVQVMSSLVSWMQQYDFSVEELKTILSGTLPDEKAEETAKKETIDFFNALYQQFKPHFFRPEVFHSYLHKTRISRIVYQEMINPDSGQVSKDDQRLLNFHDEKARLAVFSALRKLNTITAEDFTNLGIEDKMSLKIFDNLVLRGYLNTGGEMIQENIPESKKEFAAATDFSGITEILFELIYKKYMSEMDAADYDADMELELFPSDLEVLPLSENERNELYDNLIFNGYIDEEGSVADAGFFAYKSNMVQFDLSTGIEKFSADIYQILLKQFEDYKEEELKVNEDVFSELPLKAFELTDLIENLRFNDYLNDDNVVIDKEEILKLTPDSFDLALAFYPLRHRIIAALQDHVQKFKDAHLLLDPYYFTNAGARAMAALVFHHLNQEYLEDGKLSDIRKEFFLDSENINAFQPGRVFSIEDRTAIFNAVKAIIESVEKYNLSFESFIALGFEPNELADVMSELVRNGSIDSDGFIPEAKLGYFSIIPNALEYVVEGYEDFNKDIFFILHAVAKAYNASIDEISHRMQQLAKSQEDALFNALQDHLGIDLETTHVIYTHVFRNPENNVEDFMLPVLGAVNKKNIIEDSPSNNKFNAAYHRIKQFAFLAAKLGLSAQETGILFHDQDLVEKFPESLTLPANINRIDALLEGVDNMIYLFKGNRYWAYSQRNYNLEITQAPLKDLSDLFANLPQVDAAFTDDQGNAWIISGNAYFTKAPGAEKWETKEKTWGLVRNNFDDPEKIDAAFVDHEGKTFLFAGDQYVRYSQNAEFVDEGYPKRIAGNWPGELSGITLPGEFKASIDAAFESPDNELYFFLDNKFTSTKLDGKEQEINTYWGKIKNNLSETGKVDAAIDHGGKTYLFSGDQVALYTNSLENENVMVDEGFPHEIKSLISGLPAAYHDGVEGGFKGFDNKIYLFKDENCTTLTGSFKNPKEVKTTALWGKIRNNLDTNGSVNAAFAGLDGKTYLFSGNQFFRYSGSDYTHVDEGYPLTISKHWGGLDHVDAAFIMDGKTYLFSQGVEGMTSYVRYSTNDYTTPDEGYPKVPNDNWWNLPFKLVQEGFDTPDSIFIGQDGRSYLFKGNKFIYFDKIQRWWSEPQNLKQEWDSIPFARVDAAFTGKDGKTYMFSAKRFIRYSDKNYNKIDDRFPKQISKHWGKIVNNIVDDEKVDAGLIVNSVETVDEKEVRSKHTYLFSGNQFFRYTGDTYKFADEGYPKTIDKSLKNEPRFTNLNRSYDRIEACYSDRRNIYIFSGSDLHIISNSLNWKYPSLNNSIGATNAFMLEGSIYLENKDGWHKANNPEARPFRAVADLPPILRSVPENLKTATNAIVIGTDGNNYIFKDNSCYNTLLKKSYPINEEWGRVKNNFYLDNRIDSGFMGLDGKLYVFSGDQYVAYSIDETVGNVIPDFVDHNPKPIAADWGGLANVDIAFVRDEKTYLLEKADEEGNFRYITYSSDDYSKADQGAPEHTNFDWWKLPSVYVDEGFNNVDAVLFEGDNMYVVNGKEFIQYNKEEDLWSYPRPLSRIYRKGPFASPDFGELTTAFTGPDNNTYFFSEKHFVSYQNKMFSEMKEINSRWGIVRNNIVQQNRVDAAFVFHNTTYLFTGDQYVRYSGDNYKFVDEDYPKLIVDNLRKESCFANMSDETSKAIDSLAQDGMSVDTILANKRNIYLFAGKSIYAVSTEKTGTYANDILGKVKNNLLEENRVDAAFVNKRGETLLFSGDQYFKYSKSDYALVDTGYPKQIRQNLVKEENLVFATGDLDYEMDAVFIGKDGKHHFFKNKNYFTNHHPDTPRKLMKKALKGNVGKVRNNFMMVEDEDDNMMIDAVIVHTSGTTYAFKNDQYIAYSRIENEFVDEGYPKVIKNNWGNLPIEYEASIDGGFVFEGKTYLSRGVNYVRYSDKDYHKIDSIYPQKFTNRWGNWSDYLLSDLITMSRFKALQEDYQGDDVTLADFFNSENGPTTEPYKMLAELFDWDAEEVKWLKRKNGFLTDQGHLEVKFNIELVLKLFDVFRVTEKMASSPSLVYQNTWRRIYGNPLSLRLAAEELYKNLGDGNSEKDWAVLKAQMHDEMNILKRDVLVPYVVNMFSGTKGIQNARDLFEHLLIDVEMGSCMSTSNIKEGVAAIQLYFHRYFVNLEEMEIRGDKDEIVRAELKDRWKWMKNYRVWEANRKVFLYPENYIRPELRNSKTPEFKKLEEALLQGQITSELAASSFKEYLDGFAIVGNLIIAGANVYDIGSDGDKALVLFGRTRTEPMQYYYRTARFKANGGVIWEPWQKVDITINSTRVFPVFAFGRVMLFWIEIEEIEGSDATIDTGKDETTIDSSRKKYDYKASVKFTFHNFNNQWITPQVVKKDIELEYKIDAAFSEGEKLTVFSGKYCLVTSKANPYGDVKLVGEVFENLPDDFKTGIDAVAVYGGKKYYFKEKSLYEEGRGRKYINQVFYGYTKVVDAAFQVDNFICLIDRTGAYTFYQPSGNGFSVVVEPQNFHFFWFFLNFYTTKTGRISPVDAVFRGENDVLYMIRNGQYECYIGSEFKPVDGFPKPVKSNLNFNMDKFFNKLHAMEFTKDNQNYIQITYTTPKDAILLMGKLADDFKFHEGSVKTDYSLYLIMAWEQFKRSATIQRYTRDPNANKAVKAYKSVAADIDKLEQDVLTVRGMPNKTEDEQEVRAEAKAKLLGQIDNKAKAMTKSILANDGIVVKLGKDYDSYTLLAVNVDNLLKVYVNTFKVGTTLTNLINSAMNYHGYKFKTRFTDAINALINSAASKNNLKFIGDDLAKAKALINSLSDDLPTMGVLKLLTQMENAVVDVDSEIVNLVNNIATKVESEKEIKFGSFDRFPEDFDIDTNSNFTFGNPDWYCFEAKGGTFLLKPSDMITEKKYDVIRLTTTTIPRISSKLFSGGIDSLLSLDTQQINETPYFGVDIKYNSKENSRIQGVPDSDNLDYMGANSNYYWEIFFHAPFLVSQSLNGGQKFEDSKEWYEYIYDPTDGKGHWKFLPFTTTPDISDLKSQIDVYLEDPFDPHAIARLRQFAYRKSIVMRYIDNLLDWGDMLFTQYTRESINEARMLYVLAYDLLGKKPEGLGVKLLSADSSYNGLKNATVDYEFLLAEENGTGETIPEETLEGEGEINKSVISPYFFIPMNELFGDYWGRVEDRLYKIRQCLNIMGIKQPLPLFEPPIDPMALVQAASSGGGFGQVAAGGTVSVPHYRFRFMIAKAKELVQKLTQFGGDLLNALEKKDAEELSMLQNKQEQVILSMTRYIKEAQLEESRENIKSLNETLDNAKMRIDHYQNLISTGLLPGEEAQIGLMAAAATAHYVSSVLRIASGIAHIVPDGTIGLFSFGATTGGMHIGGAFEGAAETASSLAEGFSITGEALAMVAQHERTVDDWELQKKMAQSDVIQIDAQIAGAEWQEKIAQHEIKILEKEIEQNESIHNFMKDKFSNEQLYQWMAARLSGMYYQTYKLAFDMAKYAERSYQFERGAQQSDVNFVNGIYWDSQKKGLLAGESLGLDLDRMEQAFIETDSRRFEISKNVSLLDLDPVAFLALKNSGECEFSLSEALFDYDFQGHYCRQIKTISITFDGEGENSPMATLTQLTDKTVMDQDVKAVKYLLDPKDTPPASIRSGWKSNQQVALSHVDEYEKNNGLFELRFDDDRYLPFEGTGAVSTWRLEMNGKRGAYNIKSLKNVVINIKYTAIQGGSAFGNSVKGLLKPYQTNILFNLTEEFPNEWQAFRGGDTDEMTLRFTRDMFPNMGSSKISYIFTKFGLANVKAKVSMVLNEDEDWTLRDNRFTDTSGLNIASSGTEFKLRFKGSMDEVENIALVLAYKAVVS